MSPSLAGPIVIAGAGALGSVYGGLLAAAGHDVALLAHGTHEKALRDGPLTLETPAGKQSVPVRVPEDAEAGTLIVTAKAFDTDAALARVRGRPALAFSLQNGLAKNEPLVARFGPAAVAGAICTVPARLLEPGVAHGGAGITYLGAGGEAVDALAAALNAVGLETEVVPDARPAEWSKVAHVASLIAAQAATGLYTHTLLITPESARLVKAMVDEVAALAGVALTDLPMLFPVGAVAAATPHEALRLLREAGERMEARGATSARTAAIESIAQGRRTEADAVVGLIAARARAAGTRAPVTEACLEPLQRLEAAGGVPALSADPETGRAAADTIFAVAEQP
jgi:2-dehydropantoate 2-reductase